MSRADDMNREALYHSSESRLNLSRADSSENAQPPILCPGRILAMSWLKKITIFFMSCDTRRSVARISIPTEVGAEEVVGEFGKYGDGEGEFIWPTGLDIDDKENVYVTDEWMNRISAFDKEGNFYVAEVENSRVQIFSTDGKYLSELAPGSFSSPHGLAFDSKGDIYVADTGNNFVRKFNLVN